MNKEAFVVKWDMGFGKPYKYRVWSPYHYPHLLRGVFIKRENAQKRADKLNEKERWLR